MNFLASDHGNNECTEERKEIHLSGISSRTFGAADGAADRRGDWSSGRRRLGLLRCLRIARVRLWLHIARPESPGRGRGDRGGRRGVALHRTRRGIGGGRKSGAAHAEPLSLHAGGGQTWFGYGGDGRRRRGRSRLRARLGDGAGVLRWVHGVPRPERWSGGHARVAAERSAAAGSGSEHMWVLHVSGEHVEKYSG